MRSRKSRLSIGPSRCCPCDQGNQVEIWFNIFARDVLRDGVWRSKQQLVGQIMEYIKNYNELWAKPFKWT